MKFLRSSGGLVILCVASLSYAQTKDKDRSATITKAVSGVNVYRVDSTQNAAKGSTWYSSSSSKDDSNKGSLWCDSTRTPYDEPTQQTIKKHDLIQIVVNEQGDANASSSLNTDRRSRFEWDLNSWMKFAPSGQPTILQAAQTPKTMNTDSRYRQDNTGQTVRKMSLTFTITAEVIDILPNGVLMLEAKKSRKVNDETETIRLTGKVDQKKVTDNKISSDDVADLMIDYLGKGSLDNTSHPGLMGWILQEIWPF